jgi:hypothetical protein
MTLWQAKYRDMKDTSANKLSHPHSIYLLPENKSIQLLYEWPIYPENHISSPAKASLLNTLNNLSNIYHPILGCCSLIGLLEPRWCNLTILLNHNEQTLSRSILTHYVYHANYVQTLFKAVEINYLILIQGFINFTYRFPIYVHMCVVLGTLRRKQPRG